MWHPAQQRDLSESFSGAECRHQPAVSDDVGRPRLDDIKAVGWITLAGGHMDRFQTADKLFDSGQRQRLKHGHPVEQPDFLVQFSDVAVEVSQATPCHQHEAWTSAPTMINAADTLVHSIKSEATRAPNPTARVIKLSNRPKTRARTSSGTNLAVNVNKPTSTSALPIPTHASRVRGSCFPWKQRNQHDGQTPIRRRHAKPLSEPSRSHQKGCDERTDHCPCTYRPGECSNTWLASV